MSSRPARFLQNGNPGTILCARASRIDALETEAQSLRSNEVRPAPKASQPVAAPSNRDPRIDLLRGFALLMIFVDHIPGNALGKITLRNFGFSDAAEVFVLLAGFSAMLAYGKIFRSDRVSDGLLRVGTRVVRLYLFQIALVLTTFSIVLVWSTYWSIPAVEITQLIDSPLTGIFQTLILHATPAYLDILPLYIVLLSTFPLIYFGLRVKFWPTLFVSAAIWIAANIDSNLNLPNWMNNEGWFFNPLAWQFLFTVGGALALLGSAHGGTLPRLNWLTWLCGAYLVFAFSQSVFWNSWGFMNLVPFDLPATDKSLLSPFRLLNVLALFYLTVTSARLRSFADHSLKTIGLLGRRSLEVFTTGCIAALLGRLLFATYGSGIAPHILINVFGLAAMFLVAWRPEAKKRDKVVSVLRDYFPLPLNAVQLKNTTIK